MKRFLAAFGLALMLFGTALSVEVCPPKLPPSSTLTPTFAVGDIAELKCDVSARDPQKQTLHWKRGNDVMSQDKIVVPKHLNKFNVSLEGDIYYLRFVVEPKDGGKYNCTCVSGGLEFQVTVISPCNNCKYVTNKSSLGILQTCLKGALTTFTDQEKKEQFEVALDCMCTYPGPGRLFKWRWKYRKTMFTPESPYTDSSNTDLSAVRTAIDTNRKISSCYDSPDGRTHRYNNVSTRYFGIFQCPRGFETYGLYSLYVDDELGPGAEPVYRICCQDGIPQCPLLPLVICFIVGGVFDGICIIVVLFAVSSWRKQVVNKVPMEPWRGLVYILIVAMIIQLMVLLSLIGVTVAQAMNVYTTYIAKNCKSIKCYDTLDAGMVIGVIIFGIISIFLLLLIGWQIYIRNINHKNYKMNRDAASETSGTVLTHNTNGENTNPERNISRMTLNSEAAELTDFGRRKSSEDYRKKEHSSISEDEGVHVGGEAPSDADMLAHLTYSDTSKGPSTESPQQTIPA